MKLTYPLKNLREMWRAQSARPRGMGDASLLRIPKGGDLQQGACPPLLKSYKLMSFCVMLLHVFLNTGCSEQRQNIEPLARVKTVSGSTDIRKSPTDQWEAVKSEQQLFAGNAVRTAAESRLEIHLKTGSTVTLTENSFFELNHGKDLGKLTKGKAKFSVVSSKEKLRVISPYAATTIVGTTFTIQILPSSDLVALFEGKLELTRESGTPKSLAPGEIAKINATEIITQKFSIDRDSDPLDQRILFQDPIKDDVPRPGN